MAVDGPDMVVDLGPEAVGVVEPLELRLPVNQQGLVLLQLGDLDANVLKRICVHPK